MMNPIQPREASRFIAENSKDVSISSDGLKTTAQKVSSILEEVESSDNLQ